MLDNVQLSFIDARNVSSKQGGFRTSFHDEAVVWWRGDVEDQYQ